MTPQDHAVSRREDAAAAPSSAPGLGLADEHEDDDTYGGDTIALTAPHAPRETRAPFEFEACFLEEEAPATAGDLPPYARAFLACPSARLQEIPRRLKSAWQAAAKTIAEAALDCHTAGDTQGYNAHLRLFIELPARGLAVPTNCRGAARTKLQRERLLDIAAGRIPAIPDPPCDTPDADDALRGFPVSGTTAGDVSNDNDSGGVHDRPAATASARQAKRLVEQGLSSRALRALERGEPAVASADTLGRLEALHPPNPTDRGLWPGAPKAAIPRVTAKHLAQVAKELPRGSAPGPSGWTFELVQAAIDRQPTGTVAAFLIDMAQRALRGTLHWRGLLTASRLVALKKPDGGVRPIAVGEALYRVIGRLVLKADRVMSSADATQYVGRHQYGVAYPGGVEAPVHAVRELHDSGQLRAVVSLDWRNAFNSLDRVHTALLIADRAPALARLYEWSYREDSVLVLPRAFEKAGLPASLLSQAGVRQGDVLGPLFFAIGAAPVLDEIDAIPYVTPRAYLDDIFVTIPHGVTDAATKAAVAATFATAEREGAAAGLRLNRCKSAVWAADAEALLPPHAAGAREDVESCAPVREGLKILGAPVGSPAFVAKSLDGIIKRAIGTLDLVADAELPLQHKLVLLRQCVAQIPTFWARAVPDAGPALAVWDTALLRRTGALVGLDVRDGSLQADIARLPVRLGGLGLRSMKDTAPRAFVASILFAAALANTRRSELTCSASTARRLRAALPELARTDACNDEAAWRRSIARGVFPDVDKLGTTQLQRVLQGMADSKSAHRTRRQVPFLFAAVFEDAATPGSGAWLAAIPSDPTLVLPDAELAEAVRIKLLTTTANAAGVCPACHKTGIDPSHAYTCVSLSHLRTARHDVVVRRVELACKTEKPVREHVLAIPPVAPTDNNNNGDEDGSPVTTADDNADGHAVATKRRPETRASARAAAAAATAAAAAAIINDNSLLSDDDDDDDHDDNCHGEERGEGERNVTCPGHYTATPFAADDTLDNSDEDNEDNAHEDDDEDGKDDNDDDVYNNCNSSSSDGDEGGDDLDYEYSDQSVTRSVDAATGESPNPERPTTPTRALLRADLWLPATSTAVDVMVAAACRRSRAKAFDRAVSRKAAKYGPAVADGSIAKVVPFVVSPFGVLSRPAKAFLKCAMGDTTAAKQAKARLRLAVAAVRGTARLSYAWGACAALIVGGN